MAGIGVYTVLSVNGDETLAGDRLFNGRYVQDIFTTSAGTYILYDKLNTPNRAGYDKYLVSDSLEDVQGLFTAYAEEAMDISVYSNYDRYPATTTVKVKGSNIVSGVSYGTADCTLYVLAGGKVSKILCNNTITEIDEAFSATPPYDFSTWFLPSRDELDAMYDNLAAEGVGDFESAYYWSSSENASNSSWQILMSNGGLSFTLKSATKRIRPARTFSASESYYSLRDVGPGGGLIFYIDGTTYYEAAPADISDSYYWSNVTDVEIGTTGTAIGTGLANTAAIIAQSDHITSAAYASTIWNEEFSLLTSDYIVGENQLQLSFGLPAGKSITVGFGDGTTQVIDGDGVGVDTVISSYSEDGPYAITMSGDIFYLTNFTKMSGSVSGDISGMASLLGLTNLLIEAGTISGDISVLSALTNIETIYFTNNNVSGDVSSWSALTSATDIRIYNTDVSGDISSWSALTSLTNVEVSNTSVTGDISSWSTLTSLSQMTLHSTSINFDASTAWTNHNHGIRLDSCGLTSTQVDNALIAFAGGSFANKVIYLAGTNDPRTAASDAALATLLAALNSVEVNEV